MGCASTLALPKGKPDERDHAFPPSRRRRACRHVPGITGLADAPLPTKAERAVHERALTLDTHLDTPASLVLPGWSITQRHSVRDDYTQVDVPRMIAGGLDGGFWAIYTPQGPLDPASTRAARDYAFARAVAIHAMVAAHPRPLPWPTRRPTPRRLPRAGAGWSICPSRTPGRWAMTQPCSRRSMRWACGFPALPISAPTSLPTAAPMRPSGMA
jgi:hypothetical protein